MEEFRVLVCGGRHLDEEKVEEVLSVLYNEIEYLRHYNVTLKIIHGAAPGADSGAAQFAEDFDLLCDPYPANWTKYKKGAGPIRNKQMLDEGEPHAVIAFMPQDSKGTLNMVKQAFKADLPILLWPTKGLEKEIPEEEKPSTLFDD